MNEDVQLWVMAWLQELIDGVSGELPGILEEVVLYGFWIHLFSGIVMLLAIIVFSIFSVKLHRWINKLLENNSYIPVEMLVCLLTLSTVAAFVSCGIFFYNCSNVIKTCVAPKVYVIDKYVLKK